MPEQLSLVGLQPCPVKVGAVDGIEITQVEAVLTADIVDGRVVFGDGGVVDREEVGGETADGGLLVGEGRALIVGQQVGLGVWHLNKITQMYIQIQMDEKS